MINCPILFMISPSINSQCCKKLSWPVKITGILVLTLLFGLTPLAAGRIAKDKVQTAISEWTGFPVMIEHVRFKNLRTLQIENLKILNPHGFFLPIFAQFKSIELDFSFFKGSEGGTDATVSGKAPGGFSFQNLRIESAEFFIEKKYEGMTNLSLLKTFQDAGPGYPLRAAHLDIAFEHIHYQDPYSDMTRNFSISLSGRNASLQNIHSTRELVLGLTQKLSETCSFWETVMDVDAKTGSIKKNSLQKA